MAKVKLLSRVADIAPSVQARVDRPGIKVKATTHETRPATNAARRMVRDAMPAKVVHHDKPRLNTLLRGHSGRLPILGDGSALYPLGGADPQAWDGGPSDSACYKPEPAPAEGYGPPLPVRDVRDPLVSRLAPEHYARRAQNAAPLPPRENADVVLLAHIPASDTVRRARALAKLAALRA